MDVVPISFSKNPGKIGIMRNAKQPRSSIQVLNKINHKININELKIIPRISGNPILLFKNVFIILAYICLIY